MMMKVVFLLCAVLLLAVQIDAEQASNLRPLSPRMKRNDLDLITESTEEYPDVKTSHETVIHYYPLNSEHTDHEDMNYEEK